MVKPAKYIGSGFSYAQTLEPNFWLWVLYKFDVLAYYKRMSPRLIHQNAFGLDLDVEVPMLRDQLNEFSW